MEDESAVSETGCGLAEGLARGSGEHIIGITSSSPPAAGFLGGLLPVTPSFFPAPPTFSLGTSPTPPEPEFKLTPKLPTPPEAEFKLTPKLPTPPEAEFKLTPKLPTPPEAEFKLTPKFPPPGFEGLTFTLFLATAGLPPPSLGVHFTPQIASEDTSPAPSCLMELTATVGGVARGEGAQELAIENSLRASSGGLEGREVPVER